MRLSATVALLVALAALTTVAVTTWRAPRTRHTRRILTWTGASMLAVVALAIALQRQ